MKLKSYTIAGIIFVSVLGTLFHFVYEWTGNNPIIGLFVSINESVWEHMKLLFFPMLAYSFFMNKRLRSQHPCVGSSLAFGILLGTLLIPVIFYTYSGILGFTIQVLDIAIFYLCAIAGFYASYRLTSNCNGEEYKTTLTFLLCIATVAFIIFTVYPPKIALFIPPVQ